MSTSVKSSDRDRSAEIDRCLTLISPSASDESKFVGMLILPKLLDTPESIERVYKGMNFKFIERLLRTNHGVDAQVPDPVLKEIAVNILACFAHEEKLVTDQNMVDRIPTLSTVLTPNDETDVTKDALHILMVVAVNKEGLVKMLDPDALKNVFEVLLLTTKDNERELCSQLIISVYAKSCHLLSQDKSIPSLASALKYSMGTLFNIVSKTLNQDQNKLKFEALYVLASVLPNVPAEVMQKVKAESEKVYTKWLKNILNGVRDILSSKVNDLQRDRAILLISCLLRYFGNDWLFSSLEKTRMTKRRKENEPEDREINKANSVAHFPALLIHLVAIEAKVMMDEINDRIHKEVNEDKKITSSKEARQQLMIPVYFEILEAAMEYLATHYDEDKESGMDPEMLLKIRTTMSEVMDVVMELLKFMQDTSASASELDDDMVAQACIRLVSIWLAEEGFEMPE
ncbi:hypothetical protein K501DRAFT_228166 [Backusella circina FSU 941]|nr:hypothetical protein K501DRAFT_228166 [Backusella circina FSU 941]